MMSCLDGGEDGGNVVDGAPLVLQYVEADAAIRVYCGGTHEEERQGQQNGKHRKGMAENEGEGGGVVKGCTGDMSTRKDDEEMKQKGGITGRRSSRDMQC